MTQVRKDHALIRITGTEVEPEVVNGPLRYESIDPVEHTLDFPDGNSVTFTISISGLVEYFTNARTELFNAGMKILADIRDSIGGFHKRYIIMAGVLDTTLTSIDSVVSLIQNRHWDSIHNIARSVLDAYLTYDGIEYASDPSAYMTALVEGGRIDTLMSVAGTPLTYAHRAEMSSQKSPLMTLLFKRYSAAHHFSNQAFNRLSWNSGNPVDDASTSIELAIGVSHRSLDRQALEVCISFMYLLKYSHFLGAPLESGQLSAVIAEVKRRAAAKAAAKKAAAKKANSRKRQKPRKGRP